MMPSYILRQNLRIFFLVVFTALSTHFLYQKVNADWVVYRKADHKYLAKKWPEAAALFEKSMQLGLTYPVARLKLAHSYSAMGQFVKAKEQYQIYLDTKPEDRKALKDYAQVLSAMGEFEEAEKIYQKLLQD